MGGTSCDVALIAHGEPGRTSGTEINGHPLHLPMLDIQTVSAGGGSIAWADSGGALRVGPAPPGPGPGPAAYGLGGDATDGHRRPGRARPSVVGRRPPAWAPLDRARATARRALAGTLGLAVDNLRRGHRARWPTTRWRVRCGWSASSGASTRPSGADRLRRCRPAARVRGRRSAGHRARHRAGVGGRAGRARDGYRRGASRLGPDRPASGHRRGRPRRWPWPLVDRAVPPCPAPPSRLPRLPVRRPVALADGPVAGTRHRDPGRAFRAAHTARYGDADPVHRSRSSPSGLPSSVPASLRRSTRAGRARHRGPGGDAMAGATLWIHPAGRPACTDGSYDIRRDAGRVDGPR